MKPEDGTIAPLALPDPAAALRDWRIAAVLLATGVLVLLGVYRETLGSLIAIWWRSETFAHGLVVAPISLCLIWLRRGQIIREPVRPAYVGLAILLALGFVWLAAHLAQVQVMQQYAVVASIPVLVLTALGPRAAGAMMFPLGFLLLAVPVGESLIPPLMDFTADFTVAMLQLTGIPVFREGTFFNIPSGQWSVVEGCSGLRYLIASITVGILYAYLTYRSLIRRLIFVVASIAVPIVANGLRAYMIVMIAHLSDMRLALGVDHLIYGWVFFGIIMFVLFWIGSFWREDRSEVAQEEALRRRYSRVPLAGMAQALAAGLITAAVWPGFAAYMEHVDIESKSAVLAIPEGRGGWQTVEENLTDWRPRYLGADASIFQPYRRGDQDVVLYLGYYRREQEDSKLVSTQNVMVVQKHPVWSNVGEALQDESVGSSHVRLRETRLRSAAQRLLVWDWFLVSGRYISNPYLAKLMLARDRLLMNHRGGAAIILAVPYEEDVEAARSVFRSFIHDMLPSMEEVIRRAASG